MLDLLTFTLVHVAISLLGIIAGLVLVGGLVAGVRLDRWFSVFLVTTAFTSLTGFGFPNASVTPAQIVGGSKPLCVSRRLRGDIHALDRYTDRKPVAQGERSSIAIADQSCSRVSIRRSGTSHISATNT